MRDAKYGKLVLVFAVLSKYRYSSFINPSHRFRPPPPTPPTAAHNAHAAERRDRQRILLNQVLTSCVVTSLAPSSPLISVAISAFFFLAVPFSNSHYVKIGIEAQLSLE